MENFSGLKTDLYELTMAAGYYFNNVDLRATFELFVYRSPPNRSYFIACGLAQVAAYILNLRFLDGDINFLRSHPAFSSLKNDFFEYLRNFRFSGNVWAMKEGEVFFAKEPVIQVEAPIIEAQLLETYLISMMHIQSLVATKAARIVHAASCDGRDRGVVDFGSRRAHGPEAAALAARASYIGGCIGTSNVYAGRQFGIPIYGTMAHSWIEAFDKEQEAFVRYYNIFPDSTVLLIDTYDTFKGARRAAELKKNIKGVRIDSGDLRTSSRRVRRILDNSGMKEAKIVASGNLNEYKILELVKDKAPIDMFGVGTQMVTSRDTPSLDIVYKLVQVETRSGDVKYKAKTSRGKTTLPGRKQVFRVRQRQGAFLKDRIGLFSEKQPKGSEALLGLVIENGKLRRPLPDAHAVRRYVKERLKLLPSCCMDLRRGECLKTELSRGLKRQVI